MNITDLLTSLANGKGLNITPGVPDTNLQQVVSRFAQGNGAPQMPFGMAVPQMPDPAQAAKMFAGLSPSADVPTNLPGSLAVPNDAQTGGYMGVGAGLQGNIPKTPLPPPETELTSPQNTSGMTTGSIAQPSAPASTSTPDFSHSFADTLTNVGNALQGKATANLGEDTLSKNKTYQALIAKGLDPASAEAAVRNPTILQAVLPAVFNPTKNLTNDQREYETAQAQGFKGTFLDYLTTVKRAGSPQFSVTTDMKAENAESKGRGEGLAKRLNSIAEDGVEAGKDMQTLQRLSQLTSNVDPGTKTALLEQVRDLTGIALDPNTDNVQAFKAAASYLAPRMRVPGSGASSDRDVSLFMKALPSLLGTPEGNQTVIETLGGMAQQRQRRADIAAQWQRGEIGAADADRAMAALPDPFAEFKSRTKGMQQPQAGDLPVMTPEQAARAPSGTRFKDVNGKVRVKQ